MNKFFCNLLCTSDDYKSALPRLIVGLIFLSEGIQKFLFPSLGILRFEKIGFAHPGFLASFVATFEIFCGSMVLAGFLIRLAVIPLFIIIVTAIIRTK
ncbi:MAG: DoxX family protein, partial [Methanococcaceae archaeon]